MYSSPVFPTPTSLWVSERSFSSARPETKRCAVFSFCTQLAAWQVPSRQKWIFPPLTLMPCHSGRDNQLRVKSPPMIVIINLKQKNTNKTNKKQQIQGWRRDTPWDSRMHGCKMTDAGSNANECILPGWIHRCRSVCPLRTEWHTHFPLFPHWGDKNRM